jgi:DNA repair exonuclease SbcCD ATPase subunit
MRRTIFFAMGILEIVVGIVLVGLGCQLPGSVEVERSFQSAGRVTNRASNQVEILRSQVAELRRLELPELSSRLEKQTRAVTATLRAQSVDFDAVAAMRDALGEVAKGLNGLAETLDPDSIGKLNTGLGETAAFLDEKVIPAAQEAADQLDKSTAGLRADAKQLAAVIRESPPDLKAIREVYDGLGRFRAGLDKMCSLLKVRRLDTMREGFRGLESSLTAGSEQVDRLAGYTYPIVTLKGPKPEISQRPFWPEGNRIAEDMRKAAAGAAAAGKEMDDMAADLPEIRASLLESGRIVEKLREGLGMALQNKDQIEPLLKEVPNHAARLAEDLPKLSGDLSKILRDTEQLKEVARGLRQAQKGINTALTRWPELRTTLARLGTVLLATRDQLDQAVRHRDQYETAMQQTVQVADTFAAMLPLITDQLKGRLDEEEQTLSELGQGLDEVGGALPAYALTASGLVKTGRLMAWLVAGIVGLHGCYLVLSARMGRRYSL